MSNTSEYRPARMTCKRTSKVSFFERVGTQSGASSASLTLSSGAGLSIIQYSVIMDMSHESQSQSLPVSRLRRLVTQ